MSAHLHRQNLRGNTLVCMSRHVSMGQRAYLVWWGTVLPTSRPRWEEGCHPATSLRIPSIAPSMLHATPLGSPPVSFLVRGKDMCSTRDALEEGCRLLEMEKGTSPSESRGELPDSPPPVLPGNCPRWHPRR